MSCLFPGKVPARIRHIQRGCGPSSFIGHSAWLANLTRFYTLVGMIPSRSDLVGAKLVGRNYYLPDDCVNNDFLALMADMRVCEEGIPDSIGITTPTGSHLEDVLAAIRAGIKTIMVDKPLVLTVAEVNQIKKAADKAGAQVYVSFNHRYTFGVELAKAVVAAYQENGGKVLEARGWFDQNWLLKNPNCPQGDWRLEGKYCALTDIGSHAFDALWYALGSPELLGVKDVKHATLGSHGKDAYDTSSFVAQLSQLDAKVSCTQASTDRDHLDDLGIEFVLQLGSSQMVYRWELKHGCDAFFWGPKGGELKRYRFGAVPPELQEICGKSLAPALAALQPPGHTIGWESTWRSFFNSVAGEVFQARGYALAPVVGPDETLPIYGSDDLILPPGLWLPKPPGLETAEVSAQMFELAV